jgi:hypothetical protein
MGPIPPVGSVATPKGSNAGGTTMQVDRGNHVTNVNAREQVADNGNAGTVGAIVLMAQNEQNTSSAGEKVKVNLVSEK